MKRITIEKIMAVIGTGPQKTRRLIREGRLPGYMDGRDYICTPGEFDAWYCGEWEPKPIEPVAETRPVEAKPDHEPVDFVQRRKTA